MMGKKNLSKPEFLYTLRKLFSFIIKTVQKLGYKMGLKDKLLLEKLKEIKRLYEQASKEGGTESTLSEIRASKIIMPIHDYIKAELIAQGVNPLKITPRLNHSKPEIKLIGFLKGKNQDIVVLPDAPKSEKITEGVLIGGIDTIGKNLTNKTLSINIRSQLSSIAKNFDTLYERTFAEALNLHLRCPKLIMGEVYLIPLIAYDPDIRGKGKLGFKEVLPAAKYIASFAELNNRGINEEGDVYKYERVCLLIIDFRTDPPKIINDIQELVKENVLTKELAEKLTLRGLTIRDFVSDILEVYKKRHGSLDPLK